METHEQPAAQRFRHAGFLYRTADELADGVYSFVTAGIAAGEPVHVCLREQHRLMLQSRLEAYREHVAWSDAPPGTPNPGTLIDRLNPERPAGTAFRLVHEPAAPGCPGAVLTEVFRHEALANRALARSPANVLCAYHCRADSLVKRGIQRTHPELVTASGGRSRSMSFRGGLPREYDRPLRPPPPRAARMSYRNEQRPVRAFAETHARNFGLPRARIHDVVLAVGELAANTRAHTAGEGVLAIWAADDEVVCQVSDSGYITDQLAGRLDPGPEATSRRGLWIVNQVSDFVQLRTGPAGTVIRVRMHARPGLRPRAFPTACGTGRQLRVNRQTVAELKVIPRRLDNEVLLSAE